MRIVLVRTQAEEVEKILRLTHHHMASPPPNIVKRELVEDPWNPKSNLDKMRDAMQPLLLKDPVPMARALPREELNKTTRYKNDQSQAGFAHCQALTRRKN